jgi:hypothetical protein
VLSRRALITVCALLGCLVLVGTSVTAWTMHSWQVKKNLKIYAGQLEVGGFTVLEQAATKASFDLKRDWFWFGDFQSYAEQEGVTVIYSDSDIGCLYFLAKSSPTDTRMEQNIFFCGDDLVD